MFSLRDAVFSTAIFLAILPQSGRASTETIGPNGINSDGLTLSNGTTVLTGAGVSVGTLDLGRTGDPQLDAAGCHAHVAQQREHVNYQNGSLLKNMPTQAWAWHPFYLGEPIA